MADEDFTPRPVFGLRDSAPFEKAVGLLERDPVKAVADWRNDVMGIENPSSVARRQILLEAAALLRMLAEIKVDEAMISSDNRTTAYKVLAEAYRELSEAPPTTQPAIARDRPKRPLTEREVGWLQAFDMKMADRGLAGMETYLRDISRQLRRRETTISSAFRPLRLSNELPPMIQLAEVWREGIERNQMWSRMLRKIVIQEIGRKHPPETPDEWSFLRDAWRLAGLMDLTSGPAAAGRNQIGAFRVFSEMPRDEFSKLLGVMDHAVSVDEARADPDELSATLSFRLRLAVEVDAPAESGLKLLEVWTAANKIGFNRETDRQDTELLLDEDTLRENIAGEWARLLGKPGLLAVLQDIPATDDRIDPPWVTAAFLVFGQIFTAGDAKTRLLAGVAMSAVDDMSNTYRSADTIRGLAA